MSNARLPTLAGRDRREVAALATAALVAVVAVYGLAFPESLAGVLLGVATRTNTLDTTLRLSVPIALAALGGIFAEKSGVINIGLEGLLIISAFSAVYAAQSSGSLLVGFAGGVLASVVLAGLFAVVCIEFRADQIIAGLAVWLIALGFAPFASKVIYGQTNVSLTAADTPPTLLEIVAPIPVVSDALAAASEVRFFGALFDAGITVYVTLAAVVVSWYLLNRTAFGRWVRASGENPKALDTAGVDVDRVRYAAVLLSGLLAGLGGAALSLDLAQFSGNGPTMVNGKGFIAIVAYLLGNYNPIGAFLSTVFFAALTAVQNGLQIADVALPSQLIRAAPFVLVVVVLALFGRTRLPEAAGEHYESGED